MVVVVVIIITICIRIIIFKEYITAERRAMNLFFMTSAHSTGPAHSSRAQIDVDEAEETARGGHSYYLARNV